MKNVPWKTLSWCPMISCEAFRMMSVSMVRMTVARKATMKPQKMKKCATPVARLPLATDAPLPMVRSRLPRAALIVGQRSAARPIRYLRTRSQTPQPKTAVDAAATA